MVLLAAWAAGLAWAPPARAGTTVAVARSVRGQVRMGSLATSDRNDLKASEPLAYGERVETGRDGRASLRFLRDESWLEVRPRTAVELKLAKEDKRRVRVVDLKVGEMVVGARGEDLRCLSSQAVATGPGATWSFAVDEKETATLVVQEGEITVYNPPKDISAKVRAGRKCVSDANGLRITDATDADLEQAGFRRNRLEVDFANPETGESATLEVEYENNYP